MKEKSTSIKGAMTFAILTMAVTDVYASKNKQKSSVSTDSEMFY